jgi:hypothetical protein
VRERGVIELDAFVTLFWCFDMHVVLCVWCE